MLLEAESLIHISSPASTPEPWPALTVGQVCFYPHDMDEDTGAQTASDLGSVSLGVLV